MPCSLGKESVGHVLLACWRKKVLANDDSSHENLSFELQRYAGPAICWWPSPTENSAMDLSLASSHPSDRLMGLVHLRFQCHPCRIHFEMTRFREMKDDRYATARRLLYSAKRQLPSHKTERKIHLNYMCMLTTCTCNICCNGSIGSWSPCDPLSRQISSLDVCRLWTFYDRKE